MKEKKVKNILYIVPSFEWNMKERLAFKDMNLSLGHGYNVSVVAFENSYLANVADKAGIEVIPYRSHFLNRFLFVHKHLPLQSIYEKKHIDIVHCYDASFICSLSSQLRRRPLTAFIFSQGQNIGRSLKHFWYRPLVQRIDSMILMNKNLMFDSVGNLGLPNKKIDYYGMGIRYEEALNPLEIAVNFDLYKNFILAGSYVTPGKTNHRHISPLLHALKVLNTKMPGGERSKLVLIAPVNFQELKHLDYLIKEIQDLELQEDVLFVTTKDIVGVITRLDLWISNSEEPIEDFAICSIIHEKPTLFVRNFCSNDFLEEYEGVGETYKLFDARELRDKWEKLILGRNLYKEKTRLYKYFVEKEHSFKNYKSQLLSLYSRTVQRRQRLFSKKL